MKHIGKIETDFKEKFGIPRQSGLVMESSGVISFYDEFKNPDAFKGIEDFSHIWVLWEFSKAKTEKFNATVRPPKLGGNIRKGVFATRSPFRPNSIGMSVVRLDRVEYNEKRGPLLYISGVDMLDGTPVIDIKPYLPSYDIVENAVGGFTDEINYSELKVNLDEYVCNVTGAELNNIVKLLEQDPRPSYIEDDKRVYGFRYGKYEIKFRVCGKTAYLLETTIVE